MDKKRYKGKRYQRRRSQKRIYRKRRRTGFFVFVGLVVLTIGALIYLSTSPTSEEGVETVERVEDPSVVGAPEEPATEEAAEEEEKAAPPPPDDPTLYMTIPKLGIYGHTVRNDDSEWALNEGAIKLPYAGFPWEKGANTYIAGHRIGWPWNETNYQFFNLPSMRDGDEVFLTDANGTVYKYRVSEIFAIGPFDTWVTDPVPGRDMISLQTCTETPDDWWTIGSSLFGGGPESGRLIVRADRVD